MAESNRPQKRKYLTYQSEENPFLAIPRTSLWRLKKKVSAGYLNDKQATKEKVDDNSDHSTDSSTTCLSTLSHDAKVQNQEEQITNSNDRSPNARPRPTTTTSSTTLGGDASTNAPVESGIPIFAEW